MERCCEKPAAPVKTVDLESEPTSRTVPSSSIVEQTAEESLHIVCDICERCNCFSKLHRYGICAGNKFGKLSDVPMSEDSKSPESRQQ